MNNKFKSLFGSSSTSDKSRRNDSNRQSVLAGRPNMMSSDQQFGSATATAGRSARPASPPPPPIFPGYLQPTTTFGAQPGSLFDPNRVGGGGQPNGAGGPVAALGSSNAGNPYGDISFLNPPGPWNAGYSGLAGNQSVYSLQQGPPSRTLSMAQPRSAAAAAAAAAAPTGVHGNNNELAAAATDPFAALQTPFVMPPPSYSPETPFRAETQQQQQSTPLPFSPGNVVRAQPGSPQSTTAVANTASSTTNGTAIADSSAGSNGPAASPALSRLSSTNNDAWQQQQQQPLSRPPPQVLPPLPQLQNFPVSDVDVTAADVRETTNKLRKLFKMKLVADGYRYALHEDEQNRRIATQRKAELLCGEIENNIYMWRTTTGAKWSQEEMQHVDFNARIVGCLRNMSKDD